MPRPGNRGEKTDKVKNFAKVLRRLAETGATQTWLATKLGVRLNRITYWKDGVGEPSAMEWRQIAEWLGLSLDYLIDPRMESPPPPPVTADEWQVLDLMRALSLSKAEALRRLSVLPPGDAQPVSVRRPAPKPTPKKLGNSNAKR